MSQKELKAYQKALKESEKKLGESEEEASKLRKKLRKRNRTIELLESKIAKYEVKKKRNRFTETEISAIKTGIREIGRGQCAAIKKHSPEELKNRSGQQIQDWIRNYDKKNDRAKGKRKNKSD